MRNFALVLLLFLGGLLVSCGGSSSSNSPSTPAPSYPTITGNWSLSATSQVTLQTYVMGGYLTNTNGSVSGTIHLLNSGCYSLIEDVPITGTISTASTLSATSSAIAGQAITITGTITSSAFSGGTYSITGGCAGGDKGTVTGFSTPSYSNTYSGSFVSTPSHVTSSTTILATQNGPDADGLYHVTGTESFTGSPCFTSGTISASMIAGSYMSVTVTTTNGTVVFTGYITDSTGKTVSGSYTVMGGTCGGDYGTGSVSHS